MLKSLRGKCDRADGVRVRLGDYSNLGGAVMYVGGNYNNGSNAGLFKVNSNSASNTNSNIGGLKLLVSYYLHHIYSIALAKKHPSQSID